MAEKSEAKATKLNAVPSPTADLFDAKTTIKSTYTGELVIALCGPIGSPLHKVAEQFKNSLLTEFGYDQVQILRLSKIIEEQSKAIPLGTEFTRIEALIAAGNELRKAHKNLRVRSTFIANVIDFSLTS